jgi:hypothetical protein
MALTFDSVTAAELAACTNKIAWGNALIAALGANRVVTYKRAASGDAWATGTTFYAATLTGAMVVANGKVASFGAAASVATKLSADLSTGVAVFRIASSNSARWVQGTLGLTASGADFKLRRSPSGVYGIAHVSCKTGAPSVLLPAPDIELSRITIHNESATQQPADFVSNTFGCTFAQGDIPGGTYPHFKTVTGAISCPATIYNSTSWPDGSMKFCAAFLIVPQAVPGSGSIQIGVRSGGSAPAASARTTADLTSLDLKIELTGVEQLTGTWTAALNTAIASGTAYLIASGPAGAYWRIHADLRDGSNNAHGQLRGYHYVLALNNANGSFRGVRWLGKVENGWADVATDAAHRIVTGVVKRGATTVRTMQGLTNNWDEARVFGSQFLLSYYGGIYSAGTDGKYDYFQGGGSSATDHTTRITIDRAYAIKSKLVPPWNQALAAQGVIGGTPPSYYPSETGNIYVYMPDTGGRPDIGLWPLWYINHFRNQTAAHEQVIRVNSLCAAHVRETVKRKSTGNIVVANDIQPSYTGLGSPQPTWRVSQSNKVNTPVPSPDKATIRHNEAHTPSLNFWPYLFTGEQQFLDHLMNHAAASHIDQGAGSGDAKVDGSRTMPRFNLTGGTRDIRLGIGSGPIIKGGGLLLAWNANNRSAAWTSRDLAQAAYIYPDTCPYGTGARAYFQDLINGAYDGFTSWLALQPATWRAEGLWVTGPGGNQWMDNMVRQSLCHQEDISGKANPKVSQILDFLSLTYQTYALTHQIGAMTAYRVAYLSALDTIGEHVTDCAMTIESNITWTASDSRGVFQDTGLTAIQNGDWIIHYPNLVLDATSGIPCPEASDSVRCYMVNVNAANRSFQISLTPGGAPLTIPADISINKPAISLRDWGVKKAYNSEPGGYLGLLTGGIDYMIATGRSQGAAKTQADALIAAFGMTYDSNQTNAFSTTRGV